MVDVLIFVFVLNTLFAGWVVLRNGAEWLARSLFEGARNAWTPRKVRTLIASLWGLNAFALFTLLDG